MVKRKVVFSGVQPSGDPQLGNYLGAFKGWVERQEEKINYFCIVDLHALTVAPDPEDLRKQTRELAAILFACGLCLLYTSPSPRDLSTSRMPSSA